MTHPPANFSLQLVKTAVAASLLVAVTLAIVMCLPP